MFRVYRLKIEEKGQSLVEFALILPILLLLILGMIQFGIIFSSQIAVTNAAREGARVAAVGGSDSEILTGVENSLGQHFFLNPISASNISVTPNPRTQADRGKVVTVLIDNVTLDLFVPVPGVFTSNSEVVLSARSAMRLEHLPVDDDGSTPPADEDPTDPGGGDTTDPGGNDPTYPAFNNLNSYNVDDIVTQDNATYISIKNNNSNGKNNLSVAPPDPEYWEIYE